MLRSEIPLVGGTLRRQALPRDRVHLFAEAVKLAEPGVTFGVMRRLSVSKPRAVITERWQN
jgi:hypothetical protein